MLDFACAMIPPTFSTALTRWLCVMRLTNPSLTGRFEDRALSAPYGALILRKALHSGFLRRGRGQTIIFLMPPGVLFGAWVARRSAR